MDNIQRPDNFQVKDIQNKQEIRPTNQIPKKKLGLISLFTKKNLPKTIIVVLIIAIILAAAAVLWGRSSFSKAKVRVDIEAPEDIASGEEVVVLVKYKNNNRVGLTDAYLIIDYPSGTFSSDGKELFQKQEEVGFINRKSEGEKEFKARFVGKKGDVKNLNAKLIYKPQNINSQFENTSLFRLEINTVLVDINVDGSEKTIAGQEVDYLIEYENKTDEDISGLRLEIEYPDDFSFNEANPEPTKENVWDVGLLKSGEKKTIKLKGILQGQEGENKVLKAVIGKEENDVFLQYSQMEYITQISPSPLLLNIKGVEENCNAGQKLNYTIEFRNNTDIALSELILKAHFEDSVFDFTNIGLEGKGFFDSRENTITWSGAEVSILNLLEPNQSGQVEFSINIKESLPIYSYDHKNFEAKVLAEIETLTVPSSFSVSELKIQRELVCKINSRLDLDTKIYYYEPEQGIINTGPIPPRVDQLTTYTVHWQIANTSNDLENVKAYAILPQGIEWSNFSLNDVPGSQVIYNERTKEVSWEIDRVVAGAGVILPLYELIFQIGLRPSVNQVGSTPTLINESSIDGTDKFTGKLLKDFTPEVTTSLPDDSKISSDKGRVQQ